MTTYTAIINRPCEVKRNWYGEVQDTIYERREIVYAYDLATFIEQVEKKLPRFIDDVMSKGAEQPDFIILIDGIPYDEYELDAQIVSPEYFSEYMDRKITEAKVEKARLANDARLKKEREEKAAKEFSERQQYEALKRKFG